MIGDSHGDTVIRNRVIVFGKSERGGAALLAKCVRCYRFVELPIRFILPIGGGDNEKI